MARFTPAQRRRRPARKMMLMEIRTGASLSHEDAENVAREITCSLNRHRHTEVAVFQEDTTVLRIRLHGRPDFRRTDYAIIQAFEDAGVQSCSYTNCAQLLNRR